MVDPAGSRRPRAGELNPPYDPAMPRGAAHLVGREAELERLRLHLDGSGAPLLVVIGEAGVGKTRLLDELATGVGGSRHVVRGRADEHERAPLGLWRSPIAQLGLPAPGTDGATPTSELRWDVVDGLVGGLRERGPGLLVLDDLHWADDDSLWVLEHLTDRVVDADVALVATSRPASEVRSVRWSTSHRRADVIALQGLDVAEVGELVRRIDRDADPGRAEQIWRQTGGVPLFVREVVLGRAGAATDASDLLGAAIERAGTAVADVVTLVALAGPDTPMDVLAEAASIGPAELADHLERARQLDLVRTDDGRLRLRHDLLARAARDRCPPSSQRRWHRALATAWRSRPGTDPRLAAARHRVLATPDEDPQASAEEVLDLAGPVLAEGRAADVAALARLTRDHLAPMPLEGTLRARLALAEADARWALEDIDAARAADEVALTHLGPDDHVLRAEAEIGAAAHHTPMVADVSRIARLAAADAALPEAHDAVDPRLRIRLRGRRAAMVVSLPDRHAEAQALADDAVDRARRLGEPEVLARAFADRLFVLSSPEDFALRARSADELVAAAQATGDLPVARRGHEWRYAARLHDGDLPGAMAALHDMEAVSAILPSPYWRWSAALRRAGALALLGDLEGALALWTAARRFAVGVAPEGEMEELECGFRLAVALLYGRTDLGLDRAHATFVGEGGDAPLLFLQARVAQAEVMLGDAGAARRRLAGWSGRVDVALRGPEGLPTLGVLASIAGMLGWRRLGSEVALALRPFSGRVSVGHGIMIDVPVDHHLAELALLAGDLDGAAELVHRALALARRMGLPTLEARSLDLVAAIAERRHDPAAAESAWDAASTLADPIGLRLPHRAPGPGATSPRHASTPAAQDGAPVTSREVRLHLDNGRWFVESHHGSGHLADSTGLRQLLQLLTVPDQRIAAVDLAGAAKGGVVVVQSDLGPVLDARAKRAYRRRIQELRVDLDDAEEAHDLERASRARLEMEAVLDELRAAVGLGGRDRPQGSGAERARVNVSRNVRRAVAAIGAVVPDLGAHLDVSVQTGHHCSYAPEPAARLAWLVTRP